METKIWKKIKYVYTPANPDSENDIQMIKVMKIAEDGEVKIMGIYFGNQAEEVKYIMNDLFWEIDERDKFVKKERRKRFWLILLGGASAISGIFLGKAINLFLNSK